MMHHHHHISAVKSNFVDSAPELTNTLTLPLCPKPRRPRPSIPKFISPLRCSDHISSQSSGDGRGGILNFIAEKNYEGREMECVSCGSCYSVSPPGRTENPLVHDVNFLHQMELLSSPFSSHSKLSDQFGFTSS